MVRKCLGNCNVRVLFLSRTAVAVWLNMSKRKRIRDLDDYADLVVAEAKEQDWVARHACLRRFSRNATMFRNLQSRLSPDAWLHGCSTGVRPVPGCAIPLRDTPQLRARCKRPPQLRRRSGQPAVAVVEGNSHSRGAFERRRSCGNGHIVCRSRGSQCSPSPKHLPNDKSLHV